MASEHREVHTALSIGYLGSSVASGLLLFFFLAHTLKDDVDTTNDSRQITIPLAPVKGCRAVSSPRVQG
jgi:hypothetical protein